MNLVSQIMYNLESDFYQGMITTKDLIQVVTEQATYYDTDVDMHKVKRLASIVMAGKSSRKRDFVRLALEKAIMELMDAVMQLDDDHLIVCEVMRSLESSRDDLISYGSIQKSLAIAADQFGID